MKLRLRSQETKQTLKIETPNPCTLSQLRLIVSQTLPGSPSPSSIRLSLNRRDELRSNGEGETLQSLGVASGDLIFFSLVESTQISPETTANAENAPIPLPQIVDSSVPVSSSSEPMDVDEAEDSPTEDFDGSNAEKSRFSVPGFLRKVFLESIDDEIGRNHKLLIVVAIHAVMLESGFVPCDEDATVLPDGYRVFDGWNRYSVVAKSLAYKIPESVGKTVAVLKFQSFGKHIIAYGTLKSSNESKKKTDTYRVQFDSDRLTSLMKDVREGICGNQVELRGTLVEKELFSFWRSVKDNLALPLLTGLCDECNLVSPACLMRLPVDVILKVLDLLPGADLAKVSCVCSELKYLGSVEYLWLSKIERELGSEGIINDANRSFKEAFAIAWGRSKRQRQRRGLEIFRPPPLPPIFGGDDDHGYALPPFNFNPNPLMIGGDYDLSPPLLPMPGGRRRTSFRRIFSPRCDLGPARRL